MIDTPLHQHHRHQSHQGMANMVEREVLSKILSKVLLVMMYGNQEPGAGQPLDLKMGNI